MGCGSSKDENPNEIKSEMKKTLIPEYDELFGTCGEILEKAEGIRAGLGETTDTMNELAGVEILKNPEFTDSINAWLWAVSANFDGNIQATNLQIGEESPFLSLDLGNTYVECYNFQEQLKKYLATCIEGPKTLIELIKNLSELIEKAKGFNPKEAAQNANLAPLQGIKAAGNTTLNLKTLASGLTKMNNVLEIVKKAYEDIKLTLPKIKEMVKEADVVGKQASTDGNKKPRDCIKYSKKDKLTPEELEARKKQEAKKEKGKKAKKPKKDENKAEPEQKK